MFTLLRIFCFVSGRLTQCFHAPNQLLLVFTPKGRITFDFGDNFACFRFEFRQSLSTLFLC
ncbi:hypothetical protein ASE39_25125 [Acidovorax sp. Root267]|nr:hypothetical protein ASE39_25125 [Acidovorax sp. Root267]